MARARDLARALRGHAARFARALLRSSSLTADLVVDLVRRGRRRYAARPAARHAALRRRNRVPLPNLLALYPEVPRLSRRELGIRSIGLEEIRGTAVAGPSQRGSDFLPLPAFESRNWEARWQALTRATDRLVVLPPIDVFLYDGAYWVEDGHNRVAAALYNGQAAIDAAVTELRAPGTRSGQRPESLAAMLEAGHELRSAGAGGRLGPTAAGVRGSGIRPGAVGEGGGAGRPAPAPDAQPPATPGAPDA